jgi:1-acyl-sn-glycerol-3-phosphate acyltransferase
LSPVAPLREIRPMPARDFLATSVRVLCGVRALDAGSLPGGPTIYFANHSSHLDFVIIWSCLPSEYRRRVRPVAGRDYWNRNRLRRWLAARVFNAVLIERQHVTTTNNPMEPMLTALDEGSSLIVFPEGSRSPDGHLADFKGGLYHLARARPSLPLVPLYLENLNRILPKGGRIPVPLIATVHHGAPLQLGEKEVREDFLHRARESIAAMAHSNFQ